MRSPLVVAARSVAALVLAVLVPAGVAHADGGSMDITLHPARASTGLGQVLTLESSVVNRTSAPSPRMLAHVNVASRDGTYVDLEDWSANVTQSIEPLEPNASAVVTWELQAVNAGSFFVYVVLVPEVGPLVASPSTRVEVEQERTLDAGGVLPVTVLVPLLLGIGAAAVHRRVRKQP